MPKRKAPEDEMAVVWDGLAPVIGEPGSDDEVASTYDAFVQNDVGRESLRKMRNAHDGYFRRVRKRQRLQRPATSSVPNEAEAAAGSSQPASEIVVVEDARALIEDRREERGEEETEEEKKEREWQRDHQLRALERQRKFESGDFSEVRYVEASVENAASTPTPGVVFASSSSSSSQVVTTSTSSSRVNAASQSTPRPRKAAIKARQVIAASSTNIQSLMKFRPVTPGITQNNLARKLTRVLPEKNPSSSLPPPLQGKKATRSYVYEAGSGKSTVALRTAQEKSMEVVVAGGSRAVEEKEKSLREIIREEVTSALRMSQEEDRRGRREEYEEGFLRHSPSGKEYWEAKEGPRRPVMEWSSSSPSPSRPSRRSSLPSRRSPLPPTRRPTSRQDRREDRSAHSVDRRNARPSRLLPRRSPSPANHQSNNVAHREIA